MVRRSELSDIMKILFVSIMILNVMNVFAKEQQEITIIYTNNSNGILKSCGCPGNPYGGLAQRMTVIKEIRTKSQNILLLDAGDNFLMEKNELKTEYFLKALKKFNYDATTLGEREFSQGILFLEKQLKEIPFICSNIVYIDTNKLITKSYLIKEIKNCKIGIIGISSKIIYNFYHKGELDNIKVLEPIEEAKKYVKELEEKGKIDFIILISHLGFPDDMELARKIPDIDIIVGGHTQTLLNEPVKVGNTLIVQAGRNGEFVGELVLEIDNDKIISYKNRLIQLSKNIPEDEEISKIISEHEAKIQKADIIQYEKDKLSDEEINPESCRKCHEKEYNSWKSSKHSIAMESLKEADSYNPDCVRCHATYFKDGSIYSDVMCLACHEISGSIKGKHTSRKIVEENCIICHTKERSTGFDYKKYYEKIKH